MKIYTAMISTDMDAVALAGATLEALNEKIHQYVRTYWHELGPDWDLENARDMSDALDIYFENHIPMELLYIGETDLDGVEEAVSDRDKLWSEFEVYYGYNENFLNELSDKLDSIPDYEAANYLCEFNERTYDGDVGADYLRDVLSELGMEEPDEDEDEE